MGLRVLHVVPGYKPAWKLGGPVLSVSALAETLSRGGHEPIVLATNSNLDDDLDVPTDRFVDVDGVQVRYFRHLEPLKRLFPRVKYLSKSLGLLYTPEMIAELRRLVPTVDIVHTHLPFIYPTFAAARAAIDYRKPLVYHQRGVFDSQRLRFRAWKKNVYLHAVELPVVRRATLLIALTQAEAESYARLGLNNACRVIPNGIDIDPYKLEPDLRMLHELGICEQDLIILFLGRIHPIKGADRLLEAFLRIERSVPSAKLVLAGPDEFGLEVKFRERSRSAGVSGRVCFAGMVHGDLKRSLLARANLFVLPSDGEGFSMAVLEALASGTGVLLSPGCHFPAVADSGSGRIVDSDPDSLAAGLVQLLSRPEELAAMGRAGRRLVRERYTWESITDQMVEAYAWAIDIARSEGNRQ